MPREIVTCRACGSRIVYDGAAWLFLGTSLIHTRETCQPFRPAVLLGRTIRG